MTLPLSGIQVVSLTHYLQGPSCVQFLGDLGADVVKVERSGGAYERHWSGAESFVGDDSVFFLAAGRNQRSIELNLRSAEGAAVLWRLIERADVLVENFRPGVLDKLGFSFEHVRERNPGLVYCSLTGYGSTGPARQRPGQDLLVQSMSGLVALNGRGGTPPVPVGSAIIDQHAATLGALGVLAALLRRQQTGEGGRVDSNLLSAALDLQLEPLNYHLNGASLWERSESGVSSRFHQAPYGVFATTDGYLTMSLADGATLARALDDDWFTNLTRTEQFSRREEVNARIANHLATKTIAEWENVFDHEGVWNARVRDYDEVLADPQLQVNASIAEIELSRGGTVRLLRHPVLYDGAPLPVRREPPTVGADTDAVLHELDYDDKDIAGLRERGAIGVDRTAQPFDRQREAPASAYSKRSTSSAG